MKDIIISVVASIVLGYGLGCINIAYFLSKSHGFDIRKYGSGNAGASNVMIVMGRKIGLFAAVFDILKAYCAVNIAEYIFPNAMDGELNYAAVIAGVFAILGHIFPFYMEFKGGKGLAAFGGTILAIDAQLFAILFVIAFVIAVVTDYICFVPITMALVFPILLWTYKGSVICMGIFLIASIFIWYRHKENIKRIYDKKEAKFSLLWNRQAEAQRFGIDDDGESIFSRDIKEDGGFVEVEKMQSDVEETS